MYNVPVSRDRPGFTLIFFYNTDPCIHPRSKANRIVDLIRRTFIHLDEAIFTQLFKSLVRPHLEYSNATWYPYKKKNTYLR